ncbi:AsnC family transcriptional regulator, partial [Glutamicibacter ardleyensis]
MLNNPASGEKRTAQLDELDRRLLSLLSENSRRTNNSLAEELGIAASTCLARLNALR